MDESRFQIVGHADTQPLVANDSPEARERNRRVEIIILRKQPGDDDDVPEIETGPTIISGETQCEAWQKTNAYEDIVHMIGERVLLRHR